MSTTCCSPGCQLPHSELLSIMIDWTRSAWIRERFIFFCILNLSAISSLSFPWQPPSHWLDQPPLEGETEGRAKKIIFDSPEVLPETWTWTYFRISGLTKEFPLNLIIFIYKTATCVFEIYFIYRGRSLGKAQLLQWWYWNTENSNIDKLKK